MPPRVAALPRSAGGLPVPFVAAWEGEQEMEIRPCPLVQGQKAIFPARGSLVGETRPVFGEMEPSRQRYAVASVSCQVCRLQLGPMTSDLEDGPRDPLWLVDMLAVPDTLPGHRVAIEPWVCDDCLVYALQVCPGMLVRSTRLERRTVADPSLLLKNVLAVWTANVFAAHAIPGGNLRGRQACVGYLKIEPLRFLRMRASTVIEYTPSAIREMIADEVPA